MEHTLTQLYLYSPATARFLFLVSQTGDGKGVVADTLKALRLCTHPNPSSTAEYPNIFRLMLTWDVVEQDIDTFLTHYLTRFYPHTPKHLIHHKVLLGDLKRLPRALKKRKTYLQASSVLQVVLNPFQPTKAKNLFSPVFYEFLLSQIWKIHFEYERSFKTLQNISHHWLKQDLSSKDISEMLNDLEIQYLQTEHKYILTSNRWLINKLEWLAQRINTEEVKTTVARLSSPFEPTSRLDSNTLEEKWKTVRGLWNTHNTESAISAAQGYIRWIHRLPPRNRHNRKTKDALSTAYLALAQMYLEVGNYQKTISTFDKAYHLCNHPQVSCFVPYHRNLSLTYVMTGRHEKAWSTLTTLINEADLAEYDKQEYYFWAWVMATHLHKELPYTFPYLTPYRQFAACIANRKKPNRIPTSLPEKKKKGYTPITADDLSLFLNKKQSKFLYEALHNFERSETINHLLQKVTYQVLDQLRKERSSLSSPQLMTWVKTLQKYGLFVESIDILFEFSHHTMVQDLPRTFYTHFFPKRFEQDVHSSGAILNLPQALISAFIRRESLFDPTATSPAYAMGLMQVLPETAQRVAKTNGIPYRHVSNGTVGLFEPQSNVRIGAQYLHDLLKQFSGNLIYTTASYNAGEHRVVEWVKRFNGLQSTPLLFIENIPYKETRFYVKWVLLYYFYYAQLDGSKKVVSSDLCQYIQNPIPSHPKPLQVQATLPLISPIAKVPLK